MDYTILVNSTHPLKEKLDIKLVKVKTKYISDRQQLLEQKTCDYFLKLKQAAKQNGYDIEIEDAYRTHEYQQNLFDKISLQDGIEYAQSHVAKPYTSEHEVGLAIDFCIYKNNQYIIAEQLDELEEVRWIHRNCHKFGFILRYPKCKTSITGYSYEPWHIRFVGKQLAIYLFTHNLTLEEYYSNIPTKNVVK